MAADTALPRDKYHFLLFFFLVLLFVVCGTHVLETVCYSVGLTEARPLSLERMNSNTRTGKNLPYMAYRITLPLVALFFGYNCFSLKEWARKGLVVVLILDLGVWFFRSVFLTLLSKSVVPTPEKLMLQVSVVLLEAGLLWLLSTSGAKKYFTRHEKRDRIPIL